MKKILAIEKLVHGGLGLCRAENGVIFVDAVAPGDSIEIETDTIQKIQKTMHVHAFSLITPSAMRRKPSCPYFGVCGGCNWLHLTYEAQLAIKKQIISETLARIGKIKDIPDLAVFSSPEFSYRRRVQFKIDAQKKTIGFYKRRSNDIVEIDSCPLLCDPINALLGKIRENTASIKPHIDEVKAIAGNNSDGLFSTVASYPCFTNISTANTEIYCDGYVFPVLGNGFFQGNRFCASQLGAWVAEQCCGNMFLDLYGGSGFFSVYLAKKFKTGLLAESVPSHTNMAEKTFIKNGISSVQIRNGHTMTILQQIIAEKTPIDWCIVDPPRTGLEKGMCEALNKAECRNIIYVSCDIATQARDAGILINQMGYHIKKSAFFDMYPQTHHMETVLVLSR